MPRLFKKFDNDGNGELGMDEFIAPRRPLSSLAL